MKTDEEIWREIHNCLYNPDKAVFTDAADYKLLSYLRALLWVLGK